MSSSIQRTLALAGLVGLLLCGTVQAQDPQKVTTEDHSLALAALRAEVGRLQQAHAAETARARAEIQAAIAKAIEAVEQTPQFQALQALRRAAEALTPKK